MRRRGPAALLLALLAGACGGDEPATPVAPTAVERPRVPPAGLDDPTWGERLFVDLGCMGCHHIDGAEGPGGSLRRVWGRPVELPDGGTARYGLEELRESLLGPDHVPSYEGAVGDAELAALAAFVERVR